MLQFLDGLDPHGYGSVGIAKSKGTIPGIRSSQLDCPKLSIGILQFSNKPKRIRIHLGDSKFDVGHLPDDLMTRRLIFSGRINFDFLGCILNVADFSIVI